MPKECVQQNRHSNQTRQNPKGNLRQFSPQWQIWSAVNIESSYQENVGEAHPGQMDSRPRGPALPPRRSTDRSGYERQGAEREQAIVLRPSGNREHRHGHEHTSERPVVDGTSQCMASRLLSAQHRNDASNHAGQSRRDVHGHKHEKERRIRR